MRRWRRSATITPPPVAAPPAVVAGPAAGAGGGAPPPPPTPRPPPPAAPPPPNPRAPRAPPAAPPPPAAPAPTTPSGAAATNQQDLTALSSVTDPQRSAGVPPQVTLANGKLSPTTGRLLSAAKRTESNTVPLPLILSLAGLAAMAALGGAAVLRQRWPRTRAALRLRRR